MLTTIEFNRKVPPTRSNMYLWRQSSLKAPVSFPISLRCQFTCTDDNECVVAYSVFALLFLVTYAAGNVTSQLWLGISSSAQVRGNPVYRLCPYFQKIRHPDALCVANINLHDHISTRSWPRVEPGHPILFRYVHHEPCPTLKPYNGQNRCVGVQFSIAETLIPASPS